MVPAERPGYGAGCMAASPVRRAGVRRAALILLAAAAIAVVSVTLGPVVASDRTIALLGGIAPTPTPAPTPAPSPQPPTSSPSPSPSPTPSPTSSPSPTPSPTPTATALASPAVTPSPLPGGSVVPPTTPPQVTPAPIPADLRLGFWTKVALQSRLDQLRERYGIPGISVAIVMPDGSTWVGVSGLADVGARLPVTPTTSFAIASVSKTFTSALVMALVQEGRIQLDAPVRRYLPNLKKISSKILVSQLLDHTSGLRDYFFHPSIDHLLLSAPDKRWDAATALRYVGKSYFKPGTGWHYSNTNYLVLGLLAEAVGKEPLAVQIRQRFLAPLDLDRTWYQPTERGKADLAHGYRFPSIDPKATPIDLSGKGPIVPFTSVITAAGGAGGFASDSLDLARWVRALYGGGVLSAETIDRMTDIGWTVGYKPTVAYGLGVQVIDLDGRRSFGHSGRLLGFRSAVRYLPDGNVSIAVLTNQSRVDPGPILRSMLRVALAPPTPGCDCTDRP